MKKKSKDLEKMLKEQRKLFGKRMRELMEEKNITEEELLRRMNEVKPDEGEIEREKKKLGLAAKHFREKKNLSLQEVSERCELTVDEIQSFEKGVGPADYDTMVLICYGLKISLYELSSIADVIEP